MVTSMLNALGVAASSSSVARGTTMYCTHSYEPQTNALLNILFGNPVTML